MISEKRLIWNIINLLRMNYEDLKEKWNLKFWNLFKLLVKVNSKSIERSNSQFEKFIYFNIINIYSKIKWFSKNYNNYH